MTSQVAEKSIESRHRFRLRLAAIRLLALIAIGFAVYLSAISIQIIGPAGCGDGPIVDCEHVLKSRWSSWFGVPVSLFAVITYGLIFGLSFAGRHNRLLRVVFQSLALCAGLSAIWFTGLQLLVLKKLCIFCLVVHACGLVISGLVLSCGSMSRRGSFEHSGSGWLQVPLSLASLGALILIVGQYLHEPEEFTIREVSTVGDVKAADKPAKKSADNTELQKTPSTSANNDNAVGGEPRPELTNVDPSTYKTQSPSQETAKTTESVTDTPNFVAPSESESHDSQSSKDTATVPPDPTSPSKNADNVAADKSVDRPSNDLDERDSESPMVNPENAANAVPPGPANERSPVVRTVKAANVELDVSKSILIGDPDAEAIVIVMVDYCCPKCRQLHAQLQNYKKISRVAFSILVLPVPINASCNAYIRETDPKNANSCTFAKLALAVWNSDSKNFGEFHDWVMDGPSPPSVSDAVKYASMLLQRDDLEQLMQSTEVADLLQNYVEIYNATGRGQVPRLYIRQWSIVGSPNDQRKMFAAISDLLSRPK